VISGMATANYEMKEDHISTNYKEEPKQVRLHLAAVAAVAFAVVAAG
jgi:hypothetical protein